MDSPSDKPKMGRPRTEIDLDMAEKLGSIWCTLEECSAMMGIGVSTLSMRDDFLEAYKRGREQGKMSLRRDLRKMSKTNATIAIWLSKQHLGMSDTPTPDDDEFELIDNWPGADNESKPT
jgi:hypothetical protein